MRELGRRLAATLRAGDLVVLTGALGAGKTTLAQGIGDGLQVRGPVTSPTFVIARVHPSLTGGPALVHASVIRPYSHSLSDDEILYRPPEEREAEAKRDPVKTFPARLLAEGLERVRMLTGFPLEISSGYRSPELNRRVGGANSSQHVQGLAADFTCAEFGSPVDIIKAIRDSGIEFDQCILEYAKWVHISFSKVPRGRVLTIYDPGEGYLDGLLDENGKHVA